MKKIIYSIGITLLAVAFHSCDLDTSPTNAAEDRLVFDNAASAEKILNGTWANLFDSYFGTYQNPGWASLFRASDAMGNDVAVQPGKYGYIAHYSFTNVNSTSSGTVSGIWNYAYQTIDNMNHLITRIDGVPGDANLKKRVKAQAHAFRGYMYLNLVTHFSFAYSKDSNAFSIPIYLEPTTITTPGKPRVTVKEVYKQVEEDLLAAYNNIDGYKRGERKHKFDKNVIAGILARLYLQKEDWSNSQKYADIAQSASRWMTQADYLSGFNEQSNAEWIWGHGQTTDQSTASYHFNYIDVSSPASYYYSFMADPNFKGLFDTNDIRSQLFEWDTTRYVGGLMYKKFKFRSNGTGDIVLMRKAEMVLIEAESFARLGQLVSAISKLDELRAARGAQTPDLSTLSQNELIDVILIERRKELFGEGFSLSDILRLQRAVEREAIPTGKEVTVGNKTISVKGHTVTKFPDGTDFKPNSLFYLFAIPATEVQNNPNL